MPIIDVKLDFSKQLQELFGKLKTKGRDIVTRAVAEYIMGDSSHGLKHDEPYRYVSRKSAYGVTFFSEKQRRAFFAMLNDGSINVPYRRTGAQSNAWHIVKRSGYVSIVNTEGTVQFTRGQTRLHAKMGRRTYLQVIGDNIKGAIKHAQEELNRWLNTIRG